MEPKRVNREVALCEINLVYPRFGTVKRSEKVSGIIGTVLKTGVFIRRLRSQRPTRSWSSAELAAWRGAYISSMVAGMAAMVPACSARMR